jgi:hypothetical protein
MVREHDGGAASCAGGPGRRASAPLDHDKCHECDRGEGEEPDNLRVGPAQVGSLIECEEKCNKADREGRDPRRSRHGDRRATQRPRGRCAR